ncbi:MAG: precorrin-6A synthase (deacetylating) [Ilumatobacteraceae bacterium]
MRRVKVIGIGAGSVSFVTVEAAEAIAATDVFLVIDKGGEKADLVGLRREVLERFAGARSSRVVVVEDGQRDDRLPYAEAVAGWHAERVAAFERVLADEVVDGEVVGILVWGDPSLYDSTLRIIDHVNDRGRVRVEHTVVPGISSVQVLTARHRIPLNRIGGSVLVTTGRRLRDGLPAGIDDVVVMLDAETSFTTLVGKGFEIFWGAYLGSADELLVAGPLDEVADEIVRVRAEARLAKGWMFDTYLLRRMTR